MLEMQAHLAEFSPDMYKGAEVSPQWGHTHTCHLSTGELQVGESAVQGHPPPHGKSDGSLNEVLSIFFFLKEILSGHSSEPLPSWLLASPRIKAKLGLVPHAGNASIWMLRQQAQPRIQGQLWLYSEFQVSLDYRVRPCLKDDVHQKKKKNCPSPHMAHRVLYSLCPSSAL